MQGQAMGDVLKGSKQTNHKMLLESRKLTKIKGLLCHQISRWY